MKALSEQDGVLVAPETMTIHSAGDLRDDLLRVIKGRRKRLELRLGSVERMDTSAVQLLLAAKRTADGAGRDFVLSEPSTACREAVAKLGLEAALFGC